MCGEYFPPRIYQPSPPPPTKKYLIERFDLSTLPGRFVSHDQWENESARVNCDPMRWRLESDKSASFAKTKDS